MPNSNNINVDSAELSKIEKVDSAIEKIELFRDEIKIFYESLNSYEGYAKKEFKYCKAKHLHQLDILINIYGALLDAMKTTSDVLMETDEKLAVSNKL